MTIIDYLIRIDPIIYLIIFFLIYIWFNLFLKQEIKDKILRPLCRLGIHRFSQPPRISDEGFLLGDDRFEYKNSCCRCGRNFLFDWENHIIEEIDENLDLHLS